MSNSVVVMRSEVSGDIPRSSYHQGVLLLACLFDLDLISNSPYTTLLRRHDQNRKHRGCVCAKSSASA
jgi:hypothetical protein